MKIVTAAQMTAIEQASEKAGVSTDALMENAGLAVAQGARGLVGAAGVRFMVLVGPGNNGADGLVAARHLRRWGAEVVCFVVAGRPKTDPKMDLALEYGVRVIDAIGTEPFERMLSRSALVIDALLGTGRARSLEGHVQEAMFCLANVRLAQDPPKLVALDLPTGLNPDTGKVEILRFTASQDVGTAIHPSYVEGQMQGGVVQGIGWALNEEYFMTDDGTMTNSSLLDYRMPTSLDLPMIDTVIVEVPSPSHPFGVRGVGEANIVPPTPAIANAVYDAVGVRIQDLPITAEKVLAALRSKQSKEGN